MAISEILVRGVRAIYCSARSIATRSASAAASKGSGTLPSIDAIKSHGVRYVVIHGEYLKGNRYATLIPQLDRRRDMTLVSRRPWQIPGKHAEISVYRVSYP